MRLTYIYEFEYYIDSPLGVSLLLENRREPCYLPHEYRELSAPILSGGIVNIKVIWVGFTPDCYESFSSKTLTTWMLYGDRRQLLFRRPVYPHSLAVL